MTSEQIREIRVRAQASDQRDDIDSLIAEVERLQKLLPSKIASWVLHRTKPGYFVLRDADGPWRTSG